MKKLTIRLSEELSEQLSRLARKNQRSANRQVIWLIEQAIMQAGRNGTHESADDSQSTE